MGVNKISLMEAYMIETLRLNGVKDQEIVTQIEKKDVSPWEIFHSKFDFNELVKLAEQDQARFQSVILDGYKIKFVTLNGLKTLLKLKFSIIEDQDYRLTEKGITDLKVSEDQLAKINHMLSGNWVIQETATDNAKGIKIELV